MPLRLNDASIKVEKVFSLTPQNHVISIARNDSSVQLLSLKTFDIRFVYNHIPYEVYFHGLNIF